MHSLSLRTFRIPTHTTEPATIACHNWLCLTGSAALQMWKLDTQDGTG
jgi:hypothetical protein